MMKTLSWIFFAGLLILVSCKNDTQKDEAATPTAFKTYSSDSLGFSIDYPENFDPKENIKPGLPIAFYELSEDTSSYLFHPNILLITEQIPLVKISAHEFIKGSQMQLQLLMRGKIPDFKIYDIDSMQVDGKQIGMFKYDVPKNDSTSFTCKRYIALLDQQALQFQSTTVSNSFGTYEPLFDDMIKTLKFKKK